MATLASQFFLIWMFNKFPWFYNYSASGVISAPPRALFGRFYVTGAEADPRAKYLFVLTVVILLALAAKGLVRGRIGRAWMAIRDMDVAAEIIGIRPLRTKLLAFALSSFYCGIAGALWAFIYTSAVEASAFEIDRSFQILFMIIIGGLGSILGSFLGAAFIVLLPIFLDNAPRLAGFDDPGQSGDQSAIDDLRRADRLLPDCRAERSGAAVGDRQGEAAALAVPALTREILRANRSAA